MTFLAETDVDVDRLVEVTILLGHDPGAVRSMSVAGYEVPHDVAVEYLIPKPLRRPPGRPRKPVPDIEHGGS